MMQQVIEFLKQNVWPECLILIAALFKQIIWPQIIALSEKGIDAISRKGTAGTVAAKVLHLGEQAAVYVLTHEAQKIQAIWADGKVTKDEFEDLAKDGLIQLKAFLGENGLGDLEAALGLLSPALEPYLMSIVKGALMAKGIKISPQ